MKKIEQEFVKDFGVSLGNQKTFDDIKDKINVQQPKKKTSFHMPLNKMLATLATFALVISISIPSVIFIWHACNVVDPGLDDIPSISGNPSTDENPSSNGKPSNSDAPSIGDNSSENTPSTGDTPSSGGEHSTDIDYSQSDDAAVVRTILNTMGAPSLPHYVSAETAKYHSSTDTTIDVNVYLGHSSFNIFDSIPFSEFALSMDELKNYVFCIAVNYNNEQTVTVINDVDYTNSMYNVATSDLYEDDVYVGSVVHYNKYHTVSLDTQLLTNKNYGCVDVQLILKSLQDGSESIVMNTTLYYSVTQQQVIFGLRENPVLHEGDEGVITCGWEYKG